MIKKAMLMLVAFCVSAAHAVADDAYVGVNFEAGSMRPKVQGASSSMKNAEPMVLELAVGTYLSPNVRGEVAIPMYRAKSKSKDGTFKVKESGYGAMFNIYYDITTLSSDYTPYLMAGVGYDRSKIKVSGNGITGPAKAKAKGSLAYNAGFGMDFNLDAAKLGLGYRLRSLTTTKTTSYAQNGNAVTVKPRLANMLVVDFRCDL